MFVDFYAIESLRLYDYFVCIDVNDTINGARTE